MTQPFYKKASVQVAIISGIVAIIIAAGHIWLNASNIMDENRNLNNELKKKNDKITNLGKEIQDHKSEVQRLETLLTPFRTIALERYTGTESDVLKKLANQIQDLQKSDIEKTKKIAELEKELAITSDLAAPNKIVFASKEIKKTDSSFTASLRFKPTKNEKLGYLVFVASLPVDSEEKILNFWPTPNTSPFQHGPDSKKITDNGKSARLVYSLLGFGYPSIDLEVTGPTKVEIKGNNGLETFVLDIK
jgi:hypothetical protein